MREREYLSKSVKKKKVTLSPEVLELVKEKMRKSECYRKRKKRASSASIVDSEVINNVSLLNEVSKKIPWYAKMAPRFNGREEIL